jgi:hypothetical protein
MLAGNIRQCYCQVILSGNVANGQVILHWVSCHVVLRIVRQYCSQVILSLFQVILQGNIEFFQLTLQGNIANSQAMLSGNIAR